MAIILVADDSEPLRAGISKLLTRMGHEVIQATSGLNVETIIIDRNVDLLITDIIMPDRDGIELIQAVKRTSPELPIIAMSGGGRAHNFNLLEMTKRLGADTLLRKPFRRELLIEALESLLGHRAGHRPSSAPPKAAKPKLT